MGSKFRQILIVFLVLVAFLAETNEAKCAFKAIFNFGDSNTDTGGFWAAFPAQTSPFGMTFFKKPVGRATDGRLIVDFLGKFFEKFCYESDPQVLNNTGFVIEFARVS